MPAMYVLCTKFENEAAVVYMHIYSVINTKLDHHNYNHSYFIFFSLKMLKASALKKD